MTKRKVSILLLACLSVVMVILMAVPMGASAAIAVTGVNWSGTTYEGVDTFYDGATVSAFTAGSQAKVAFNIQNTFAYDVNIKSVKVTFDWGQTYDAVIFPAALKAGESSVVRFDFAVPATDGINAVVHSWELKVAYESQDAPAIVTKYTDTAVGTGIVNQVVTLTQTAVEPDSVVVYVNGGLWTSGFSVNLYNHSVTFTTAVTAGQNITIYYRYGELLFSGDNAIKAGYLNNVPAVSTGVPFLRDTIAQQHNPAAAGYTVDLNTGKVTLTTAPPAWQSVYVSYTYYPTFTQTGTGVAAYSADQAAAQVAAQKLDDMDTNYPDAGEVWSVYSTAGERAYEEAMVLGDKADAEYAAGDFANSKTDYEAAVVKMQAAWDADTTLNTSVETGLTGLLTGAGGAVDAYGAKLNAEAKNITDTTKAETNKLNGEADMAKNLGVFYIMLGVATLLAGIGGILWAYSRLVAAKGPKQI